MFVPKCTFEQLDYSSCSKLTNSLQLCLGFGGKMPKPAGDGTVVFSACLEADCDTFYFCVEECFLKVRPGF